MNNITVERILMLLEKKNVDQKDLAAYLGTNKQTVTDWKSGKTKSYKKSIDRIAEFFGVSVDYLLGRTDNPNETGISVTDNKQTSFTGNNSISINSAVHNKKDTLTEQFMRKFEQLDFDDKVDVMQYVIKKKSSP